MQIFSGSPAGRLSAVRRWLAGGWVAVVAALLCSTTWAQTCGAPGKDAPAAVSGVINRYYQGNGNLAAGATTLTLGAASGAAGTVTAGDLLLVVQMQGATIASNDDVRYGDGTGQPNQRPDSSLSQANGYTNLGLTGNYQYLHVTAVAGNVVTFTPALTAAYQQNIGTNPRRTYQVVRVPQYPSITVDSAQPVEPLPWNGLVGGVVALDVAGRITFSGAGPHIQASNRGFRGGDQGVSNSTFPSATNRYRSNNSADGGSKGEGIAGTPRYVQTSVAGSFDGGTRFSDAAPTRIDNGAGALTYPNGNFRRGAPANAGGGGNSHNAAGGGGGNGGEGGNGGQTYDGDGLLDTGGYGGSRTPQDGVIQTSRIFMGGGGGSGSLNDGAVPRGAGGNGGGIILLRAGRINGGGILRADGQRGWDSDVGQDAGGGGGAGGTIVVTAGSGHGALTAQARGGHGADSNLNTNSLSAAPPFGTQLGGCCAGEREGPGGGGGGGVVMTNSMLGGLELQGGANGLSREDKFQGFSGNMRASPGAAGASLTTVASSAIPGVRPGYECLPEITVTKRTTTPTRSVPPDTTGQYTVHIANAANAGIAYGVALADVLPAPFTLSGASFGVSFSAGASAGGVSGPASLTVTTAGAGTSTLQLGTPGDPLNALTLGPGASATVTFTVSLNAAPGGVYQNSVSALLTDPTRSSGSAATAAVNPFATPGGTTASGDTLAGSNYSAATGPAEDITVTGAAGTLADLALTKSGPATVDLGQGVQYTLDITHSGPSNIAGSATISDQVPALVGTVTWSCSVVAGTGDCDTAGAGTGAAGSGNSVVLPRVALDSGGALQVVIQGVAASVGTLTNTATVEVPPGFTDPVPGNNRGTVTTTVVQPTADLSISKSDGTANLVAGGVTAYVIVAANAGPSAAHGAVVTDPAAAGLQKLDVSCSAQGGASCPSGLSTTTFQAGATLPLFPAGSTVTFVLTARVTVSSGTVTNSVFITAPAGLIETNPANDSASDAGTVALASAAVVSAAGICPAGTVEQTANLLANSNFADTVSSIGASVTQYPLNTDVPNTGVGPQQGARLGYAENVGQRPFPGDVARSVAAAENWLYSNGNSTGSAFRLWSQSVSGLVAGRTYLWMYYGSNAREPGNATPRDPSIQQQVTAGPTTYTLSPNTSFPDEGAGTSDTWTLVQRTFSATTTGVLLALFDTRSSGNTNGDNFAVTQILLRECRPIAEPFVAKTNGTSTVGTLSTTLYVVTVGNNGPGPADGIVLRDPASPGVSKNSVSCSAQGSGAQCPLSLDTATLESTGLPIPALPAGTTLHFTITASITALNGTVGNVATIELPAGMSDGNLDNNEAIDIDTVRGLVNLAISKSNDTDTLAAGSTTTYVIAVTNGGPSDAAGAILTDPPAAGLSCVVPAVCTASGGASCGAPDPVDIPATELQDGFAIPALPAGGTLELALTCAVTATGS